MKILATRNECFYYKPKKLDGSIDISRLNKTQQEEAIQQSANATTLQEVHETAKQKLGNPFIHGIGHSLGIEVHDTQPRPTPLTQGTAYKIEPGIS